MPSVFRRWRAADCSMPEEISPLIYVELLDHADDIRRKYGKPPIVALYENVPGIFSDRTNAFGCLVGGLAGEELSGYGYKAVR